MPFSFSFYLEREKNREKTMLFTNQLTKIVAVD